MTVANTTHQAEMAGSGPVDPAVLVSILRERFFSRVDVVSFLTSWNKACPATLDPTTTLDALLLGHVLGGSGSYGSAGRRLPRAVLHYETHARRREPGQPAVKNSSVALGPFRIGSYTPNIDGLTACAAIDIDGGAHHSTPVADPDDAARQIMQNARALGVTLALFRSGSGTGWHIFALFSELTPAPDARELMFRLIPARIALRSGGYADPDKARGIEVFPKADRIAQPSESKPYGGCGNQVWLPWWGGSKAGGGLMHPLGSDGRIDLSAPVWPQSPADMPVVTPETVEQTIAFFREVEGELPARRRARIKAAARAERADRDARRAENAGQSGQPGAPSDWAAWRTRVLAAVDLEAIYGDVMVGPATNAGWIICRDPHSDSGEMSRAGGVADGSGDAPRGTWHSFMDGRTLSPFDWLVERGRATDFMAAARIVASLTGIPIPGPRWVDEMADEMERIRLEAEAERAAEMDGGGDVGGVDTDAGIDAIEAMLNADDAHAGGGGTADDDDQIHAMLDGWDGARSNGGGGGGPGSADGRPEIWAEDGDLPRLEDAAWLALQTANIPTARFFRFSSAVADVGIDEYGFSYVRPMDQDRLWSTLGRVARWYKLIGGRGEEKKRAPAHPPAAAPRGLFACPDPPLPILHRVTEFPFFAETGELCATPGYHAAGRAYYSPAPGFALPRAVPRNPTGADVSAACGWIDELLRDFPFVGAAERAHAIALLLLPFARDLVDGATPMHNIEAPTEGTGKGLLAAALLAAAVGKRLVSRAGASNEEEWQKALVTALLPAPSIVFLDNLEGEVSSAHLASAITQPIWCSRILGGNKEGRFLVRCVWVMTGNNVTLNNDILRRAVRIRLDAQMPNPSARVGFGHELPRWAYENRAHLAWSALVLIQAWIASGRPLSKKRMGSFDEWAGVMGGILENAEISGFLENRASAMQIASGMNQTWTAFAALWWEKHATPSARQTQDCGTKHLIDIAEEADLPLGGKDQAGRRVSLGRKLLEARGKCFDVAMSIAGDPAARAILRLEQSADVHNARMYRLVKVDPDATRP